PSGLLTQSPSAMLWIAAALIFTAIILTLLQLLFKQIRKNNELSDELQTRKNQYDELKLLLDCVADQGKINYITGFFNDDPACRAPENNPVYKFALTRSESLAAEKKEEYLQVYRKFFSGAIKEFSIKYSMPVNGQIKELCDCARTVNLPDSPEKKFILTTMDISELAKQNRELANADTILNAIFDNLPGHIVIKSMASNFTYLRCNNSFSSLLQMHPEEIAGKTDFDLFNNELAKNIRHVDMQIAASHSIADNRWFFSTPDGKDHAIRFISRPLKQPDGSEFIIGFGIDVTRQERIAGKLRKRNKDLRLLLAQTSGELMLLDNNLHVSCATPSMHELFPDEALNREKPLCCSDICSCNVSDKDLCPAAAAAATGEIQICRNSSFSGKYLYIKPLPDENGSISNLAVKVQLDPPEECQE
ncbi:MAG: PAS domain-containing protein, partial [Lentisphaeria bacterium]|nr:PAS domain-containing protein [Lentisphaeria bacterium]